MNSMGARPSYELQKPWWQEIRLVATSMAARVTWPGGKFHDDVIKWKNIFRVTGHLCGEFTGLRWIPAQRPVTRGVYVFFDLRLDGRLSKHSWGWWLETPSCTLWGQSNVMAYKQQQLWSKCIYTGHDGHLCSHKNTIDNKQINRILSWFISNTTIK